MNDPQDKTSRLDRYIWVPLTPLEKAGTVALVTDESKTIPYEEFFVRQLPGGKLGYEIVDFDPDTMTESSFGGYRIGLEDNADQFSLFMMDEEGEQIPGSARQIRAVRTNQKYIIYILSALPLLFGLGNVIWRRSKVQSEADYE